MQRAINLLTTGASLDAPYGCSAEQVGQVVFADDAAFVADSVAGLQLMFDVAWAVARASGLTIGVNAKGTKTAWSGGEWRLEGGVHVWHECGADHQIVLPGWPNPILVPYVPLYKHLGTQMEALLRHEITRKRVAARCRSLLGLLGRLGVLNV